MLHVDICKCSVFTQKPNHCANDAWDSKKKCMSESPLFSLCSLLCLCSVDVQVDTETSEVMFTIRSAHFISEKRGELCVSVRVCGHYINVQKRSRSMHRGVGEFSGFIPDGGWVGS